VLGKVVQWLSCPLSILSYIFYISMLILILLLSEGKAGEGS